MSSRRRSVRALALAALTAVAMFAALELLARAFGLGAPPPGSRGLSTRASYLAPDPALSPAERRALEQAESSLQQALAICPDHPRALFELGLVGLLLQRDPAEVRRLFEAAASGDRRVLMGNLTEFVFEHGL